MSRRSSSLLRAILALAGLALAGCGSKTVAPPPTAFGVNVTVDGTALTSTQLGTVKSATLTVTSDKTGTPYASSLNDLPGALKSGLVHFHYTPHAGIKAGEKLSLVLELKNGSAVVASGSDSVTLEATAVVALITLSAGGGDGGPNPDGSNNDGAVTDAGPGEVINPDGSANGTACTNDDECGTGFCTDGVCCNERCHDVCASCNGTTTKGTCTAYAADTDPELECTAKIPTTPSDDDAGTAAEAGAEAGADSASADAAVDSGAEAGTNTGASDAAVINVPDGGFMTMPTKCGGTCGGGRSCKYPGTDTSCGKAFCNSRREQAAFVCDGNGGCGPAITSCKDYACDDATGACRTSCSDPAHCLLEDYCTGGGACTQKKGNSISCSLPSECASGNCSGPTGASVCCNTACDGAGQTCTEANHVGQCQCQGVTCATGVACQVFYMDADHDTFGDATGTIANGRAKAGCTGSPPTGFVADKTDCDDSNSNAFPTQTMYFGAPRANGTYDYNCSGSDDKLTPEYLNGVCRFCGPTSSCSTTTTSCTGTTATGSFQCPLEGKGIIIQPVATQVSMSEPVAPPEFTSRAAMLPYPPVLYECCGCQAGDKSGFVAHVACGAYAYKHTCGTCNGSTENADTLTYTQQTCH